MQGVVTFYLATFSVYRRACRRSRTFIEAIDNAIAVVIKLTAFRVNWLASGCSRTLVHVIAYAIAVTVVRAAICINSYTTWRARALVFRVLDTVAIAIEFATPDVNLCACRRVRAIVRTVFDPIAIRVHPLWRRRTERNLEANAEQAVTHFIRRGVFQTAPELATDSYVGFERAEIEAGAKRVGCTVALAATTRLVDRERAEAQEQVGAEVFGTPEDALKVDSERGVLFTRLA